MDQRVDDERRTDAVSDRGGNPSSGAPKARRSWMHERRGLVLLIAIMSGLLLLALLLWWLHARRYESSDDAFIDARTVQISPQISAAIVFVFAILAVEEIILVSNLATPAKTQAFL